MSIATLPLRARLRAHLETSHRKGRILSHLLGAIIASEFVVGTAAGRTIPFVSLPLFTEWLDFPIRMLALWLLLDRNWRTGRLKVEFWDVITLAFPVLVGLAYPLTSMLDASIPADFESYRGFLGTVLRFYTIYLLVREGYHRAGFRGDIVLRWVLGALALSAIAAIGQALNIGFFRDLSIKYYGIRDYYQTGTKSVRARGFAPHWNGFGAEMVFGLIFTCAPLNWRRLRPWEWGLAALLFVGLVASTSRGAYVTAFVTLTFAGLYFLWTRRPKTGMPILAVILASLIVFFGVAFSGAVPKLRQVFAPNRVHSQDLGSFDYRMERARRLYEVGLAHPLTGTGPSDLLYENNRFLYHSASAVEGILDVSYPLIFAQFGITGLIYIGCVIYNFIRFGARRRAGHPYAVMAFLVGIAFAVDSIVEAVFVEQPMILVSLAAGFAVSRVSSYSKEVASRRFSPLPSDRKANAVG